MRRCLRFLPRSTSVAYRDENLHVEHLAGVLQRCAGKQPDLDHCRAIHARVAKSPSIYLANHLLIAYFKCSPDISVPLQLFDEMPHRNVVSWSASISALIHLGHPDKSLALFCRMRRSTDIPPNEFTLVSTLKASATLAAHRHAPQIYALVVKHGFESNIFLANAFLASLISNNRLGEAAAMFERCENRDVVSWNTLMAGYLQYASFEVWGFWCRMIREEEHRPNEFSFSCVLTGLSTSPTAGSGLQAHAQLVKYGFGDDVCVGNSLVDFYLKTGSFEEAAMAFNEMPVRDVVSWTQMASGCLLFGKPSEAIKVIHSMKAVGVKPNKFTLATMFNACSNLGSVEEGKKAHGYRIKLGSTVDDCVDNALIDMYAKCGAMDDACQVFESMEDRTAISWTTIIMGFAQNGNAWKAMKAFDDMILEHVEPNYITFICVLYACTQGGFVDEGWKYFRSMAADHGVEPGEDHYACMVDLLGKAGHIADAEELILRMPLQSSAILWQTLLGACRVHGDEETGKRAAERAMSLEKNDPSAYLLLSNMYADSSNWDRVGRIREQMDAWDIQRTPGSSWIETDGSIGSRCSLQQRASR